MIDETADIKRAVASILMSNTFDNGVICASEQSVIVVDAIYDTVRERFRKHGGFILNKKETEAVRKVLMKGSCVELGHRRPVGAIAELAGIKVPPFTKVLVGEVSDTSTAEAPFAHEKLSPTLAMYRAGTSRTRATSPRHSSRWAALGTRPCCTPTRTRRASVLPASARMKTARILINSPSSHGGIGDDSTTSASHRR